jgi:hypothetical protein
MVGHLERRGVMPRESYAATVARHTAILEELHMQLLEKLPPGERLDYLRDWNISMHEIEKATLLRMDQSAYEAQRRDGKKLAETLRVVAPRRG